MVARTLTLFAQPATAGSPDHVIQFGTADVSSSPTRILPPSPAQAGLPVPVLNEFSVTLPNPALTEAQAPPAPPLEFGRHACLRSTVILI